MSDALAVKMTGITKRFLETVANDAIDFSLAKGEICALLGENGAGKTTLMNILFGYYAPDEGTIEIDGRQATFSAPRDAIRAGLGMVHQHFTLVGAHTVLENIIIGDHRERGWLIDRRRAIRRLTELQARIGLRVDLDARVSELSVGEQQKVEILKAIYHDSQILITDEPTAVLGLAETRELFEILRRLKEEGHSVVFISHKLKEVMEIADRVVVLRNGRVVDERIVSETDVTELARLMVGREVVERLERPEVSPGDELLSIQGLTVRGSRGTAAVADLSLSVRRHEVVGIAGVSGNGQKELCDVLFGLTRPDAGEIRLGGDVLSLGNPALSVAAGIARIPEDRMGTGLLLDLSVAENLVLEEHSEPPFAHRGWYDRGAVVDHARRMIEDYSVRTSGPEETSRRLSGGNLQKLILARELHGEPGLVVAAQPTRGLDVGSMEYVHRRILSQKERGAAVLLISDDLDEILNVSDTIVTIYEGRIVGTVKAEDADRERIGLWMSGVEE